MWLIGEKLLRVALRHTEFHHQLRGPAVGAQSICSKSVADQRGTERVRWRQMERLADLVGPHQLVTDTLSPHPVTEQAYRAAAHPVAPRSPKPAPTRLEGLAAGVASLASAANPVPAPMRHSDVSGSRQICCSAAGSTPVHGGRQASPYNSHDCGVGLRRRRRLGTALSTYWLAIYTSPARSTRS
jgi:hypothetical protein